MDLLSKCFHAQFYQLIEGSHSYGRGMVCSDILDNMMYMGTDNNSNNIVCFDRGTANNKNYIKCLNIMRLH